MVLRELHVIALGHIHQVLVNKPQGQSSFHTLVVVRGPYLGERQC
jgi:hypothetical protein